MSISMRAAENPHPFDYYAFGFRVKIARLAQFLTQEMVAEAAGISVSFFGHIERGTRIPSIETLMKLAYALNVTPNTLLGESGELYLNDFDRLSKAAMLIAQVANNMQKDQSDA